MSKLDEALKKTAADALDLYQYEIRSYIKTLIYFRNSGNIFGIKNDEDLDPIVNLLLEATLDNELAESYLLDRIENTLAEKVAKLL